MKGRGLLAELLAEVRSGRAELAAVRAELAAIRAALDARQRAPLARDLAAAAALLPELVEHFGRRALLASEVIDFAAAPLSSRAALRDALVSAVGAFDAGAPRRLGKFLRRIAGRPCVGFVVERLDGADRAGALWCVRVSAPTKPHETRSGA